MTDVTTCFECGAHADYHHHVVPRSRGGTRTVPLCGVCHAKAHHRDEQMSTAVLTRAALAVKARRSERVGQVPFGYRLAGDGTHLETAPAEQRVVELVRSLRADGLTLQAIVDKLNADNVPARGARWHMTTVVRILERAARDEIREAVEIGEGEGEEVSE